METIGKFNNLNVLKKLFEARQIIKKSDLKKAGRNEYSNYDYYTPEQVDKLVSDACEKTGLIPLFELKKNEMGYFGELTIIDTESGETLVFTMPTDVPEIKATNTVQQLGGCVTYTERYLLMTAFAIKDNNLDPDSKEPPKQNESKAARESLEKPFLTQTKLNLYIDRIRANEFGYGEQAYQSFIDRLLKEFRVNNVMISQIKKEFLLKS